MNSSDDCITGINLLTLRLNQITDQKESICQECEDLHQLVTKKFPYLNASNIDELVQGITDIINQSSDLEAAYEEIKQKVTLKFLSKEKVNENNNEFLKNTNSELNSSYLELSKVAVEDFPELQNLRNSVLSKIKEFDMYYNKVQERSFNIKKN